MKSVGNVYNVQVERYLKGSGTPTLSVIQSVGLDFTIQGDTKQFRDTSEELLLGESSRYLLFLQRRPDAPHLWMGPAQPYKFLLADGMAKAESPVGDLGGALPDRPEAEFIREVEGLIARSR